MARDLIAKLVLSKEEIVHLYLGGVLSVKIKGKDRDASVEIFCGELPEHKGTQVVEELISLALRNTSHN